MKRLISITLYIVLTALVIAYIDNGIRTHNVGFYHGKDDGYILRFESIIILNTLFHILMTIGKTQNLSDCLMRAGQGFLTAIIVGIIGYLVFLGLDSYGLTFHVATIIICYSLHFVKLPITNND